MKLDIYKLRLTFSLIIQYFLQRGAKLSRIYICYSYEYGYIDQFICSMMYL